MSWFVFVIRLKENYTIAQRNALLQKMIENHVQVSNYFPPVHLQPFIAEQLGCKVGDFPITDSVCKSTIALPFHTKLTKKQVKTACSILKKCLDEI